MKIGDGKMEGFFYLKQLGKKYPILVPLDRECGNFMAIRQTISTLPHNGERGTKFSTYNHIYSTV